MKNYVVGGGKDKKGFRKISWSLITNLSKKARASWAPADGSERGGKWVEDVKEELNNLK